MENSTETWSVVRSFTVERLMTCSFLQRIMSRILGQRLSATYQVGFSDIKHWHQDFRSKESFMRKPSFAFVISQFQFVCFAIMTRSDIEVKPLRVILFWGLFMNCKYFYVYYLVTNGYQLLPTAAKSSTFFRFHETFTIFDIYDYTTSAGWPILKKLGVSM